MLKATLKEFYPAYLNNVPIKKNTDLQVINKYNQKVASKVTLADSDMLEEAIKGAVKAAPLMASMPSFQRKTILEKIVNKIKERKDELAHVICVEAGKPINDAVGEVSRAIDTFTIAMEESIRINGEFIPLDISSRSQGYTSINRRFPLGPVAMISPFNFPINLVAHKIAPALAVGCPFVLKPASRTPICALILGEIMSQITELPVGAFSILPLDRKDGEKLITDERFKLISFTGSPEVGWDLKSKAGKKKVCLELGGNAACVIDEGSDLEDVVPRIVKGAFYQSGQSCISVQRLIVHESLYQPLIEKFKKAISELKKGDPEDKDTFLGPLISEGDAKRVEEWVNKAVEAGGKLIIGGKRDGVFYDATVVENPPHDCKLYTHEVFGPVCTVEKFKNFKEAIELVNDSKFGLQAGVFTQNLNHAFYAYEHIEAGGVVINDTPSIRIDSQPYGGVKDSGFGREGLKYTMEEMTEIKVLILRNAGVI